MKYNVLVCNIFRMKKLLKFSLLSLTLICSLIILVCSFYGSSKKLYNNKKEFYLASSFLRLDSENSYEQIKKDMDNISTIKKYYPLSSFSDGDYSFSYIDPNLISIVDGRQIEFKNEILIPNTLGDYNIGESIKIFDEQYTIVGIYDVQKYPIFNDTVSYNNILCHYDFYINHIDTNEIHGVIVQIDDYDNLYDTIPLFKGYDVNIYDTDTDTLLYYNMLCNRLFILKNILVAFEIIVIMSIIIILIHDNTRYYSILKALGYSNSKILFILIAQIITIFILSLISSITITLLLTLLINLVSNNLLSFDISSITIALQLLFINVIATFLFYFRIKKINIVKVLKNF